jgi:hypothetical protein
MLAVLHSLGMFVVDFFKPRWRLEAENLFLRHQLAIALRRAPARLRLCGSDRALLVLMTRLWPSLLGAARVVQPETVLRWHRAGFKAFWRWKSRNRVGRPKIDRGEVYDIANNQITGAAFLGTVGLDWQFAGVAPVHAAGASDLVLRNVNTGAFEVYDIANNQITGAAPLGSVGLDWQLGGFAADPPTGSGSSDSTSQLVQAMAGFDGGSGAGESLNTVALGADASQQTLLTAPHA